MLTCYFFVCVSQGDCSAREGPYWRGREARIKRDTVNVHTCAHVNLVELLLFMDLVLFKVQICGLTFYGFSFQICGLLATN